MDHFLGEKKKIPMSLKWSCFVQIVHFTLHDEELIKVWSTQLILRIAAFHIRAYFRAAGSLCLTYQLTNYFIVLFYDFILDCIHLIHPDISLLINNNTNIQGET